MPSEYNELLTLIRQSFLRVIFCIEEKPMRSFIETAKKEREAVKEQENLVENVEE